MVATSLPIDLNLNPNSFLRSTTDDHTPVTKEDQTSSYDDDGEEEEVCSFQKEVDDGSVRDLSNENSMLKQLLMIVWDNYKSLQTQLNKLTMQGDQLQISVLNPKKRKLNHDQTSFPNANVEELPKNMGIRRVYVRTDPADKTLVVKDEYQWRKYGQKVTRDNPSPRAYYKCSFAPTCPVKKKVQRSVDDAGLVVATYEGEHNHKSRKQEAIDSQCHQQMTNCVFPKFDDLLLQQMATYLGKDPNFTQQLAAAISSRIL